ncbi:MAG: GGDEF domain-containing protein, partial [Pseudoxanthomonas sp.]
AILLVSATGIAVVRDYAGKRPDNPWLRWLPSIGAILILCVAIACLMGFTPGGLASQRLVTACWAVATLLSLLAFVGAILRKAWLGVPLLLALLILGFLGSLYELSIRGMAAEFWGRFGYQIGLIFAGLVLVVALIGRVADFRIRHDRERNARLASESRLEQQEAYVELTQQLRKQLAHAAPKDIEWTAMQMSMARLLPLLQLSSATILLYRAGYDPILVTEPATQTSRITALTAGNATTLRSVAQRQMEVAALPLESNVGVSLKALHTYAGVPFVAKGGMGVALLERAGNRPFMADELALASRFAVLVQDITGEARTHERLRRAAELDVLTGILNRNAIDAALSRHFNAAFEQQQALAILFLDMDYFKSVNDSKGHACGDHCLQQLANTLRGALGPNDLLGRYGGEEFMVVLPAHDETLALQVADRLRARVESSQVQWHGQRVCLTVSVGVAVRLPQEQMPAAALERADRALYAAKHAGRNRVEMGR